MLADPSSFDSQMQIWLPAMERANKIALLDNLDELIHQALTLVMELGGAQSGMLYLLEKSTQDLLCKAAQGDIARLWQGQRMMAPYRGPLGEALAARRALTMRALDPGPAAIREITPMSAGWSNAAFLPLLLLDEPLGVLQLVDYNPAALPLLEMVVSRLVSDLDKAHRLHLARQRHERLDALVAIFGQIGATLDRDQILGLMVDYAREVINAEASSLFLVDEERGDIFLHLASNISDRVQMHNVRVPAGKGIIGSVVQTGQVVLVPDVSRDQRHYGAVDQTSGFVTRSILAVPLRSRQVVLGGERGALKERVIGGFEAVNKIEGTFDEEDARLLTMLANQAATVLEIATLYADANELFLDVIKAMTAAIDAKDPYTEGHSQRVSDFSVEIAREMGLPNEVIHHLRIGSLLHDIGKIGIPDHILGKPGQLTVEEFEYMKQHPTIGARIMSQVRMLNAEIPAISEHHERMDGGGYPAGLSGDAVSLFGRIVAVADVFDALTSNRPYHKAKSAEETLDYLYSGVDHQFDRTCVDALLRSYLKGNVLTQQQRELLAKRAAEA